MPGLKTIIAAFDFDGTITSKDTFFEFIKFSKGSFALYIAFFIHLPLLILYKINLYPNWKVKQMMFSYLFKGMDYTLFCEFGEKFSIKMDKIVRIKALNEIEKQIASGNKVYVISASISEWLIPWCKKQGIDNVLATRVEVDKSGKLTGRFSSLNCYGKEKVRRLLEVEPNRDNYILYAYGDSLGDKELIEFSDAGWYDKFK